uniref:Bile acid:sodium symporter n=1 Tax=Heterosigma akashiwo TaxID=2829 RepID=A0A6S9H6A7_HETAK
MKTAIYLAVAAACACSASAFVAPSQGMVSRPLVRQAVSVKPAETSPQMILGLKKWSSPAKLQKNVLDMSSAAAEPEPSALKKLSSNFVNMFPVWTALSASLALVKPELFTWFTTGYFTAALGLLMLCMGITLSPKDFADVAAQPVPVGLGFLFCYGMMPLLALGLGKGFSLSPELLAGLVLVGSVNGGQASNLCTYIAKGNVALSVTMTTATTIGAIFMTPLLSKYLLGTIVPIDALGIAKSTIQVVLAPIVGGMLLNKYANKAVTTFLPLSPVIGVISTILLVSSAVAQCAQPILDAGLGLQWPIIALHVLGGLVGYFVPKALQFDEVTARTMAIETSMKSSAFGFLLAKLHFAQYAARVPSAVSVVWMAVTGATMAVIWRFIPVKDEK